MNDQITNTGQSATKAAYADGWRVGLATGALAAAVVAFVSLLGIEKAVLAAVLSLFAVRGAPRDSLARRLSMAAFVLAAIYAITYLLVLVLLHDRLAELLRLMQNLG